MNSLIITLIGVYVLIVSARGNGQDLLSQVESEKNFAPWIVAMIVLGGLYANDQTRKLVTPFFALVILATVLKQNTSEQIALTYKYITGVK
jgi:hypothetical protein